MLLALVAFGETLGWTQLAGGTLVLTAAVLVVGRGQAATVPPPAALADPRAATAQPVA